MYRRGFRAVRSGCAVLGAVCFAASGVTRAGELLLAEQTLGLSRLEPLQMLPDGHQVSPASVYRTASVMPAGPEEILLFDPVSGRLDDTADLAPSPRADYLCARTSQLRYDPATAHGFEPIFAGPDPAPDLQEAGRLRWLDAAPEPATCASSPLARLSRSSFDFGIVAAGHTENYAFAVYNAGDAELLVGSIGPVRAPFSVTSNLCTGATLAKGTSCTFAVSYAPAGNGQYAERLPVRTNDPLHLELPLQLAGGYIGDPIFHTGFE